ncbi:MAG: hypothetical protein V1664_04955 [Candidatus Uhrbacteria bacterium]
MESEKTQNWYHNLISECNTLAERFGLDDFHVDEMRQFVERVAREQFKSGSKSGYRWAKQGGDKKLTPVSEAAAA